MSDASSYARQRICFVGLQNLPVLAPEYAEHGAGGEQVQQTLLARKLAAMGYPVSMVVADYGQADGAQWHGVRTFKAYGLEAGIPVLRFLHPRWSGLWSAMRRADADIYYLSCAAAQVGQAAMFTQLRGRSMIFRVASDADCDPKRLLVPYFRDRKLYEYGLRSAAAVLVQTQWQQAALLRNYGVNSTVAGMLVDPAERIVDFAERDIDALWVSNLLQLKRPELFIDLALSEPERSFHMVGGRAAAHASTFANVIARTAAARNLTYHGRVPYVSTALLFERARVFVNTSTVEGFPNSYLQAWVRGTPVVAFFDPDNLIAREGLGIAVTSPAEMQDAIRALATDQSRWEEYSRRCITYMKRQYSEEAVLAPYVAAISGVQTSSRRAVLDVRPR